MFLLHSGKPIPHYDETEVDDNQDMDWKYPGI